MSYLEQERAAKAMEIGFKVLEIVEAYKAGASNMGRSTTFPLMSDIGRSAYVMSDKPTQPNIFEISVSPTWSWKP